VQYSQWNCWCRAVAERITGEEKRREEKKSMQSIRALLDLTRRLDAMSEEERQAKGRKQGARQCIRQLSCCAGKKREGRQTRTQRPAEDEQATMVELAVKRRDDHSGEA